MDFFDEFPSLGRGPLRDMKKAIDASFKGFSREYGEALEAFFYPLLKFMVWFEKLLIATPWPIILLVIGALAWVGSRNIKLVVGSVLAFGVIGFFGMWDGNNGHYFSRNDCLYWCWYSIRHFDGAFRSHSVIHHAYFGCDADHPIICVSYSSGYVAWDW